MAVPEALREELLALVSQDSRTRSGLVARGELYEGYHPQMAAVHARNAEALERIVDQHGWPGRSRVGEDGAEAAWLVLQHAIAHPRLLRKCLPLLREAADAGEIPAYCVAYLEDRICGFEERPQRYGTQFDWDENGQLNPLPLEDPGRVDDFRRDVGLGPLSERLQEVRERAQAEGDKAPADFRKRQQEKRAWARSVGWL